MCGICGSFATHLDSISELERCIEHLSARMARRGPDDEGTWSDGVRCTLGFRRLAILDTSPAGHQPMVTQDGRYALVYNGEVYNYRELRSELRQLGVPFRSTGDSEVVLYALATWGADALCRFNGMFALGFYDSVAKRLLLARDAAGVKPIYYLHTRRGIVFASQYDQILSHPWSRTLGVSSDALALYLRLGYIPAPYAIMTDTHMLEPGTWLEVSADGTTRHGRFYAFPVYREPDLSGEEAVEAVDAVVTRAVQRHLLSDVPVGTFLSGGIDSPLVAAKARQLSGDHIRAYTIGTNGDHLDESADARAYALAIGIEQVVEQFVPDQALALLDDVVAACSEPFADYSVFPTMLVSRLARRDVKVMLSGDGGDELFWGYAGRFASVIELADGFGQPYWLRSARWGARKVLHVGDAQPNLRWPTIGDWYRAKHTRIPESWLGTIFLDLPAWPSDFSLFSYSGAGQDRTAQWLRWNEFVGHLTMVLLKVDRASMYHSLEVRVPLLDREVIDVATRVDWRACLDVQRGVGKLPLRRALARHVPRQTHAKRGFSVPMNAWLRGPLRPVFEDQVLQRRDILGLPVVRDVLRAFYIQHLNGEADHAWGLWLLLSLAMWEETHYGARNGTLHDDARGLAWTSCGKSFPCTSG